MTPGLAVALVAFVSLGAMMRLTAAPSVIPRPPRGACHEVKR